MSSLTASSSLSVFSILQSPPPRIETRKSARILEGALTQFFVEQKESSRGNLLPLSSRVPVLGTAVAFFGQFWGNMDSA